MMETENYIIRQARPGEERDRAIEYVSANFQKTYSVIPPRDETPRTLFIALSGATIVGSLALDFGVDGPLPHERLFHFDSTHLPIPGYVREQSVYYSRWNSSRPNIGLVLWLEASMYAIRQGALFSASSGKPFIYKRFREKFGCIWHKIPKAEIQRGNVPPSVRNYFFTRPKPSPRIGIIHEQIANLHAIVEKLKNTMTIMVE